ncbi:zinc-dependent alcohol dehydrogenase family protein [Sulfitobacter mediterraneus]|uniref:zinc-dependent alcohol dehydrogenase family protein n=1 Tax=Sulfitobacter mediterraneus TaxID=83219 RepID=UPI001933FC5B|nr:zinc-dependent alcohol dehydrogenase family protein [Sulfitobacter mediterraneus]MBM1308921.1 zinc-dependent alcohol dehydrogenase family protein [Sulfitobacter mediterraneus]MBM1312806.1 zinc-dependent alcohol dehydrogenase family protein [Sulfitobacter mediterraneus]MBM1321188.1 zinc-dependent alcohol dehydrogenase family protein [Sulfitobacter mediterraneus]MBM1325075.1 zinc-dependent alcohol dehydrogenase family protein [Sulfitobacter mediterraneus]MBM1396422.1 zinc-dependent alcohol de
MKQVIYETFGNPADVLKVVETPDAPLGEGQVRVQVLRAPINPSDLIQVSGNYGVKPPLPAIAGNEGLGRIVEGPGEGQLVLLPAGQGTWVSEAVCDPRHLVPLPEGDLDQLSMLLVNPATAALLLSDYVNLKEGDWVIQSAANSAVGGYLVQLAKAKGINVACVVRRESAVAGLKELGADVVLVDSPDLARDVKAATGAKMKLAVDAVAGKTAGRLADTLEPGGTLVNYGGMSNEDSAIGAAALIFNNITVRGFWLVTWMNAADKATRAALYADLAGQIAKGTLFAPIDRHFTLDEIAEAAKYSWAGERNGKVMIAPNGV